MKDERRYRFKQFEMDPARRELRKDGVLLAVTPKAFAVLLELVRQPGVLVRKEEFLERVWPGTYIQEGTLAQNISTLRRVLGSAEAIEAVSKAGYRFTWTVDGISAPPAAAPARSSFWFRRWILAGAGTALCSIALLLASRSSHAPPEQREALALVREGYHLMRRSSQVDTIAAAQRFEAALVKVPGMALARAGLAEAFNRSGRASFGHARDLALQAVRDDPGCGECRGVLGYILMTRDWQWADAGKELRRAIVLEQSDPQLHVWFAQWWASQGRFPEARREAELAVRLDPARPGTLTMLAGVLYLAGQYSDSIREAEKAIGLNPTHAAAHDWIYRSQLMLGREAPAVESRANVNASWMRLSEESAARLRERMAGIYRAGGRNSVVRTWLDEVAEGIPRDVHRYERAVWRIWIGDRTGALEELEAAVASKPFNLIYVASDPVFATLRTDLRFQAVLRQVGLQP